MRTLIVDDEPVARAVLRDELQQFAEVEIVGEAESGPEALTCIATVRPDLVFLDLQMPGMSGLDVVRTIGSGVRLPVFIVVTAYDQYAIRAFETGAVDYLLKPITHERLAAALNRVGRVFQHPAKTVQRIVAKSGYEFLLLATDEVFAFQADGDVVWIITARQRLQATETLREIQEKLKGTSFKRIHRKALVNVAHVRKISSLTSHRWLLTLSNNLEFVVSKRQAKTVREILNW
jgi:DNA-binding LytR/AlgR family response regulator